MANDETDDLNEGDEYVSPYEDTEDEDGTVECEPDKMASMIVLINRGIGLDQAKISGLVTTPEEEEVWIGLEAEIKDMLANGIVAEPPSDGWW